jgi:drug/metabolite transporter (DMT)-like permease
VSDDARARAPRRGAYLALGAAALFGASAPLAKTLLGSIAPQLLAGLLYAGSGIGLWVARRIRRPREARLTRADYPWLAGAVLFGGVIAPVLLMMGLVRTPASGASLLLNLEGVFTALLAWTVFRENVDRRIALGMVAIAAGGTVLAWEGQTAWGGVVGPAAIAGACFCWGVDNNLTQRVSGGDPIQIAMIKGLVSAAVNTTIAIALGAQWPAAGPIGGALFVGLVSYGVSLVFFVLALRHLGTARTGAYFSTAPFVGAVLSLLVFRERPSVPLLVAAAFMGVGVWIHLTEHHEHEHRHDAMDHAHAHVHDQHHQHEHGPDDPPVTDPKPHTHAHHHVPLTHSHSHFPDTHHRHEH